MSTRSNIIVKATDDWNKDIQLYRHSDGYPNGEHGVISTLTKAFDFAWELPRMESDDFAAAIIRAWKEGGGDIRIDGEANPPESLHGDIEFCYVIEADKGRGTWKVTVFANGGKELWTGHIGDEYPVEEEDE